MISEEALFPRTMCWLTVFLGLDGGGGDVPLLSGGGGGPLGGGAGGAAEQEVGRHSQGFDRREPNEFSSLLRQLTRTNMEDGEPAKSVLARNLSSPISQPLSKQ